MKAFILTVLLAIGSNAEALMITNPWDNGEIGALGEPDTTTYGYVFTAPNATDTQLNSFSFWLIDEVGTSHLAGGVATWTGTGAGPALFTSVPFSGPFGSGTEVTINTGGLQLTSGQQYVAYFTAAGLFDGSHDWVRMALSHERNGGGLGFAWDNSNGLAPNNRIWFGCTPDCGYQLAGSMDFSPTSVPEPATLFLLGFGLAGMGFRRRGSF